MYAYKVDYVSELIYKSFAVDGESLNRLINGYIGFLKKSKQGTNEPGANYTVRDLTVDYMIEDNSSSSSDSNVE